MSINPATPRAPLTSAVCRTQRALSATGLLAGLLQAGLSIGCAKGDPPRSVRLELPELVTSEDATRVVVNIREQDGNLKTAREGLEFSVEPPELATVSPDGFVHCGKSGDGKVSVNVRGVEGKTSLRCRIVSRIEVAELKPIDLSQGELEPAIRVLDKSGKELNDVPVQLAPKVPSVVKSKGPILIPASVGKTDVVATAGAVSHTFLVNVVKHITSEALPIENGRRIDMSLDEGRYELVMELPEPKPITVRWRGAAFCNVTTKPEKLHSVKCDLSEGGGISFDNPAWLLNEDPNPDLSRVKVFQIP